MLRKFIRTPASVVINTTKSTIQHRVKLSNIKVYVYHRVKVNDHNGRTKEYGMFFEMRIRILSEIL